MKAKQLFLSQLLICKGAVCVTLLCIASLGLIKGIGYTEAIRQITDAIWTGNKSELTEALLFSAVIIIANFFAIILKRICIFTIKQRMEHTCEDIVFKHYTQHQSWAHQEKESTLGAIWKIIPDSVEQFVNQAIMIGEVSCAIVAGCIYGVYLNKVILIISLLSTVVMVLLSRHANKAVPILYSKFGELNKTMYSLLGEQVRNREISLFLNLNRVMAGYGQESKNYVDVLLRIKKATNGAGLFSQFGASMLLVLTALVGGHMALKGQTSFSTLLAMLILVPSIASNFFMMPQLFQEWKKVEGYWCNLDQILNCDTYKKDMYFSLGTDISTIILNNVSYCYPGQKEAILKSVNLVLSSGRFYAITGASGCGKSTLIHILAKLLPNWSGTIALDTILLEKIERESYWSNLTLTEQVPVILPHTLLTNITLEDSTNYDTAKLNMAIHGSSLDKYIQNLPDGLGTHITEKTVSKGERIKIALSRALYRDAQINLFDEITEGVDPESTKIILESLARITKQGKMVICVSHNKDLLAAADQVIFMQDGHIANIASHEYLLKHDAQYFELLGGEEC